MCVRLIRFVRSAFILLKTRECSQCPYHGWNTLMVGRCQCFPAVARRGWILTNTLALVRFVGGQHESQSCLHISHTSHARNCLLRPLFMKPSFYHLAFELCSEVQSENGTASIEQRLPDDFYPTLSFRPFSDTIRSTSERSSSDQRRKRAGFDPLRRGSPQRRCFAPSDSRHSRASHGRLSFSSPTAITIGHSDMPDTHREADTQDWRFGKISVDSIDMEEDAKRAQSKQPQNLTSLAQAVYNMGGSPLKGKYVPSCSKTSDLGWGVVHLYRDIEPSDGIPSSSADRPLGDIKRTSGELCSIQDCTTLCILAVPTYMTPPDLLGWLGESTREEVSHFRLVRTGRTNKYMVLLKFRDAAAAASWQRLWDCKPFNSTEVCTHITSIPPIGSDMSTARKLSRSVCQVVTIPITPRPPKPLQLSQHGQ